MAQFGTPTRTPIKDAASGNIVAPKVQSVAVQATKLNPNAGYKSDVLDKGIHSMAGALGAALGELAEDRTTGINAQKTLDAAMRQGQEQGINEADADNKRTGWKKAIFGQDAGYVEAQRRAATNAVRANAIEVSANMVTHAGTPPDEFMNALADQKTELLEKYDDSETRLLVSDMFDKQAVGLARTQMKEHEGYTQLQNKETALDEIQKIVDQANIDGASGISTPDAANRLIMEPMNGIFSHSSKPTNMADSAYQQTIVETIASNLEQGNVSFFRAADNMGYLKKLTTKQTKAIKTAKLAMEGKLADEAAYIVEDIQSQALDATSAEEVDAIYKIGLDQLNAVDMRHPDLSFKAKKALATQESEAKSNRYTYMQRFKALEKEKERDVKAAIKKDVAKEQAKTNKENLRLSLRGAVTADLVRIPMSNKDGTIALDGILMDDINRVTGNTELTPREAAGKLLIDDKANKSAVRSWKQTTHSSDVIDATLQAYVNSDLSHVVDMKGQIEQEAIAQMGMVERFHQANPKKFAASLGSKYGSYLMKIRGINAGQTADRINNDIKAYEMNKLTGKDTYIPTVDHKGKNVSKVAFVTNFLEEAVGRTVNTDWFGGSQTSDTRQVTSTTVAESLAIFSDGIAIHQGDAEAAKKYTLDIIRNSGEPVTLSSKSSSGESFERGMIVYGASNLNIRTPLGDIIQYGEGKEVFAGLIKGLLGDDVEGETPITKLGDIPNLEISTITGYDGIFLSTPTSPNPIEVTIEQLQMLEQDAAAANEKKLEDAENAKIVERKKAERIPFRAPRM